MVTAILQSRGSGHSRPAAHRCSVSPRLLSGDPHPGRRPRHPDCGAEEVCGRPRCVCGAWVASQGLMVLHGVKCVGYEWTGDT